MSLIALSLKSFQIFVDKNFCSYFSFKVLVATQFLGNFLSKFQSNTVTGRDTVNDFRLPIWGGYNRTSRPALACLPRGTVVQIGIKCAMLEKFTLLFLSELEGSSLPMKLIVVS